MAEADTPQPPLFEAAQADDASKVKELIAGGTDPSARHGTFAWTALHNAAGYGASAAIEALLAAGVAVDVRSNDGETPLHIAAQEGNEVGVRLLLENKADINATNDDGETALHTAVQHIGGKATDHIATLLDKKADPTAKDTAGIDAFGHATVSTNRAEEIKAILGQTGAKPSPEVARQFEFSTAVKAACTKGNVPCVEQLLKMSSDPAAIAQESVCSAAKGGHTDVIEALVAANADVRTARDENDGCTPLIAAADENAVKMVKWLLAQRCDATEATRDGATALMGAALRGSDEAVTALLSASADVDHRAYEGWTALMAASQAGNATVARRLLDGRADLSMTNASGESAKDLATKNGRSDVVKLLDTRLKLNSRRAKASASNNMPTSSGASQVVEDTRDMDSLLAALGEPTAAAGSSAAAPGKNKKKGSAKAAGKQPKPKTVDEGDANTSSSSQHIVSDTREVRTENVKPYPPAADAEQAAEATARAHDPAQRDAKDSARSNGAAASKPARKAEVEKTAKASVVGPSSVQEEEAPTDRLSALKNRLQEIDRIRAELDKEELSLRRDIMKLEKA